MRIRRIVTTCLSVSIALPSLIFTSPTANAAGSGDYIKYAGYVKKAYDLYNQLNGEETDLENAVKELQMAISEAKTEILTEIDRVAAADVQACSSAAVVDFADIKVLTPDNLQRYASEATLCTEKAKANIGAISDGAAIDAIGFALNAVGPISMFAREYAGMGTSLLRTDLTLANQSLMSKLTPHCYATAADERDLTWDLICTAFNGNKGFDHVQESPPFNYSKSIQFAMRETSYITAQSALTLLMPPPASPAPPSAQPAGVMADFNGDGKADFAGVAGSDLWIHRNNSAPGNISFAWSGAPNSSGWRTVSKFMVSDIDNDGKDDIIGFNGGDELMIWRSTSTATTMSFAPYKSFGTGWSIFNKLLPLADYNGDGKVDFAGVAGSDLWIHRNNSTPGNISFAWSGAPVGSNSGTVSKFMSGDIDNDGKDDIIGFNGGDELMIWRSTSTATTMSFAPYKSFGTGWSIFSQLLPLADYDGDGKVDFAGVAGSDLWIHRNNSTPGNISFAWSGAPHSSGWRTVSKFMGGDIDNDGKDDIIGFNGGDELMIWRSTSTATTMSFTPYQSLGTGSSIFRALLTNAPTL
ncbi:FG-GAP repeat domain-containing protein [Streptomyces sp. NPDC002285]